MWMCGGTGDGAFELVKKLFDNRVMRRHHESREFDPITETAFEVEGVPNQHSGTAGNRFEDMPAVDDIPVHAVEGEFNEPSRNVCGACVSDLSMPAAGALGQRTVQNHWAPVSPGPELIRGRSEGGEQPLDCVEACSWEQPFVNVSDSPAGYGTATGPADAWTMERAHDPKSISPPGMNSGVARLQ